MQTVLSEQKSFYYDDISKVKEEITNNMFFISPYGNCSVETVEIQCKIICNNIKSYQNQINQIQLILSDNVSKFNDGHAKY